MNEDLAIILKDIWKKYKIYQDKPVSLKERFLYKSKGTYQEKWVLKDISLSIPKGKMIGLIGRNGAGKSTLLKVLTRILKPDKGELIIKGRVSSLLELGAGFHMDFTGRENIFMNSSLFGLSRKEINSQLDSIVDFSELGTFIDNPVRTYSSGMFMRLAFSIAIHVNPDILLIDEILAVGDNAFQKKCISKIEEFKKAGKTIVFVSHDNAIMERLCDEIYWIHDSKVKLQGKPIKVIAQYLDFLNESEEQRLQLETQKEDSKYNSLIEFHEVNGVQMVNKVVEITTVTLLNPLSTNQFVFEKGQTLSIEICYLCVESEAKKLVFGFGIFKMDGTRCYSSDTYIEKIEIPFSQTGKILCHIDNLNLVQGDYYLNVNCFDEDGTQYDNKMEVKTFKIHSKIEDVGIAYLPHNWEFIG